MSNSLSYLTASPPPGLAKKTYPKGSIMDMLLATPTLSLFCELIMLSGLDVVLGDSQFKSTIFAITNSRMPQKVKALPINQAHYFLTSLILPRVVSLAGLQSSNGCKIQTRNNDEYIYVTVKNNLQVRINEEFSVLGKEIDAINGKIHILG